MKAAIYVRVSTSKKVAASTPIGTIENKFLQNPKVQEEPLIKLVTSRNWATEEIYVDRMSGANSDRPAYKRLMKDARRGAFQAVVVWRFDRFARSSKELLNVLEEFRTLGITFVSHQEAIDTSTPIGKVMFTIIAAFAEFERDILRERIIAGLENARENGTKSGRPIGGQKKIFRRDEAIRLLGEGRSYREVARTLKVAVATLHRACSVNCQNESGDTGRRGRA